MPKTTTHSLSHDGRGISQINGKVTFIDGALPNEEVEFSYLKKRAAFDEATMTELISTSPFRTQPLCQHFGVCGGCSLQHLDPSQQIKVKQQMLLDQLQRVGGVQPLTLLPPMTGPIWGYRHKARLSVAYLAKRNVSVGFYEKNHRDILAVKRCETLHPRIGTLLIELKQLIEDLEAYRSISYIETAVTDDTAALVFRHVVPLEASDKTLLVEFGKRHHFHIYLQPNAPERTYRCWPEQSPENLMYRLPDDDINIQFQPTDFTQINPEINRALVKQAVELLAPTGTEKVLDLFCGLGNFTLPLARHAAQVVGIEGHAAVIARAKENAIHNHIDNVEFHTGDLEKNAFETNWAKQHYSKILLDPPRTGALNAIKHMKRFGASRIVYISCNPATLARDTKTLVQQGYILSKSGIIDMFPHTSHVESIAVFDR